MGTILLRIEVNESKLEEANLLRQMHDQSNELQKELAAAQGEIKDVQGELADAQTEHILADLAAGCSQAAREPNMAVALGQEQDARRRLSDELLQERHKTAKVWADAMAAQNRATELHDALCVAEEAIKVYEEVLEYSGELPTQ